MADGVEVVLFGPKCRQMQNAESQLNFNYIHLSLSNISAATQNITKQWL